MDKYVFKPYDAIFPKLFKEEKERLSSYLTKDYLIEHIGSTAVTGLGGKGIIDIIVAADESDLSEVSLEIQKAGYEYRAVASMPTRLFFRIDQKDPVDGTKRYHLHLVAKDSHDWKDSLAFRDYLINHPDEVGRYNELKQKAAEEANQEGEIYKQIKEPFIKEILRKAGY